MIFKCDNCGGNVVYSPEKKTMCCPHCEGIESQKKVTGEKSLESCINCGAPLTVEDYTSAAQCAHCGSYLVFDERVEGEYEPHLVLPFKIGKEGAKEIMRERFRKKVFTPSNFLSAKQLEGMKGIYVPFFMYDFGVHCNFQAEGTRRKVWRSGDTEYTETSYYDVVRKMDVDFDKIPVDASLTMDDKVMDLMEPYTYDELEKFKEEYLSGFYAEMYNEDAEKLRPRAKEKAARDAETLLNQSVSGYSSLRTIQKETLIQNRETNYALLPVWSYLYSFGGKTYRYYINGQTGKAVGVTPVSFQKLLAYGGTVWVLTTLMLLMLHLILGVI